jgi:hypothetical protein
MQASREVARSIPDYRDIIEALVFDAVIAPLVIWSTFQRLNIVLLWAIRVAFSYSIIEGIYLIYLVIQAGGIF